MPMIRTMLAMSLGLGPSADATKDNVNKPATIHTRASMDKIAPIRIDGFSMV
jgi:hypothetical protein